MIKVVDGKQLLLDFERPVHIRDSHSITEQTGFLTPEQQVNRMMAAGVNLMAYRREFYDFPDGNVPDDAQPDPTEKLGFDLADASMMLAGVEAAKQASASRVEGSGEKTAVSPGETSDDVSK